MNKFMEKGKLLIVIFLGTLLSIESGFSKTNKDELSKDESSSPQQQQKKTLVIRDYERQDLEELSKRFKSGDKEFLRVLTYDKLEKLNLFWLEESKKVNKEYVAEYLVSQLDVAKDVVESLLGALQNRDPRIRLYSIAMLRTMFELMNSGRLGVKQALEYQSRYQAELVNQLALYISKDVIDAYYLETVVQDYYLFDATSGNSLKQIPYVELSKLTLLSVRCLVLDYLRSGKITSEDFSLINPMVFFSLTEPIWLEDKSAVPIYKLRNNVDILLHALDNYQEDERVPARAAEILVELYYGTEISNVDKNKIEAYRKKYKVLDEAFKRYAHSKKPKDGAPHLKCSDEPLESSEQAEYLSANEYKPDNMTANVS